VINLPRPVAALVIVAGLAIGACTSTASPTPAASTATPTPAGSVAPGASSGSLIVSSASSASFGSYLVGPNGMTLYTHAGDSSTTSTCIATCAVSWPPLTLASGQTATASSGVTGTFGTIVRDDGSTQVTYNGMPLYYWVQDMKAGDITGNGIEGFAVATVSGSGASPTAAPTTTPTSTFSY
jgi:predicted lipoprotein with Yx(FWY)xxD motif